MHVKLSLYLLQYFLRVKYAWRVFYDRLQNDRSPHQVAPPKKAGPKQAELAEELDISVGAHPTAVNSKITMSPTESMRFNTIPPSKYISVPCLPYCI